MNNNDVLRRLRYALDFSDPFVLSCFEARGATVTPAQLVAMLKRESDEGFSLMSDDSLAAFLDGLVEKKRGKRDEAPETRPAMSNNRVLRSIKIALELKDTDILEMMELAGFPLSKGQLTALFRREGHPNYHPCGDQILRNFLRGLTRKCRGMDEATLAPNEREPGFFAEADEHPRSVVDDRSLDQLAVRGERVELLVFGHRRQSRSEPARAIRVTRRVEERFQGKP